MDYSKRISSISQLPNVPEEIYSKEFPMWHYSSIDCNDLSGYCLICGKLLTKKKKIFCSPECRKSCTFTTNNRSISSVSRYIHIWYEFECQKCGKRFFYITKAGVKYPIFAGVVHHIIPYNDKYKGGDEFNNLTLLCKDCHQEIHNELRGHKKMKIKDDPIKNRMFRKLLSFYLFLEQNYNQYNSSVNKKEDIEFIESIAGLSIEKLVERYKNGVDLL